MKKRIVFILISMVILVPAICFASGSYVAGDLTKTAISDSLEQGNQVHFHATLSGGDSETYTTQQIAFYDLLSRVSIDGVIYFKEGQKFEKLSVNLDEMSIFSVMSICDKDGSIQFSTNLTNDLVFTIPMSFADENFSVLDLLYDNSGIQSTDEGFDDLPAMQRLKVTVSELTLMITKSVLGWVSHNQIDTDGEFYSFDFTYLEPTETRSGVTQRMLGKVTGDQFCALLWDIMSIIDWQGGEFQEAITAILAENGVTRLQTRSFADYLFPNVSIDPAEDYVEPTHAIKNGDDPCSYTDISYFFKKANRYLDKIWEESYNTPLELVVSYNDDYGYAELVGLDAVLPVFSESLPYEGTFTYSKMTDDDWQVLTTSHGELQIDKEKRLIGDYRHLNGEDIDGHNGNIFDAYLILHDLSQNERTGFEINGEWTYDTSEEGGEYFENTSGIGSLVIRLGAKELEVASGKMDGVMKTNGEKFEFFSDMGISLFDSLNILVNANMIQEEISEINIAEGKKIDLLNLNESTIDSIKNQIKSNAITVFFQIIRNDNNILNEIETLLGE